MNRNFILLASSIGLSVLIGACEPATQTPTTAPPPATPVPAVPPETPPTVTPAPTPAVP
ncbi:beta-Ig-H3/fasciclin [Anabaena sp. UHCC 0399]|uniref:beta-Ig-H3/fasciclin n=1 Tax=Anabaena sp. UHCC 0399 TaxID=3110238 RepID=UPI0016882F77|nr:beta-Ig-H3/fasciclin [Anabaena sp. UHCC 0399]MBD2364435.1 beta-Ig-H3/fasciclin [Anabaena minutissima FACHB-250]MEA5568115.1 beta-Ig-H3/fasciclin [Anabaena sp. UHCC 0399]